MIITRGEPGYIYFTATTNSGGLPVGHLWAAGELKIMFGTAAGLAAGYANATLGDIVPIEDGHFALELDATQTNVDPCDVFVYTNVSGVYENNQKFSSTITEAGGGGASATAIRDAILDYVLDNTGPVPATIRGMLRRLDGFTSGKFTGMLSNLGRVFKRDGSTLLFEFAQTLNTGTRQAPDITVSEAP